MKNTIKILLLTLFFQSVYAQHPEDPLKNKNNLKVDMQIQPDQADRNNDFYDNEETFVLPMNNLYVGGEIENPGNVDLTKLVKRSVIVKEALLLNDTGNQFIGAYRYDGFSLFDILRNRILKKKNASEFRPIIDMYVEIENDRGEKVVLSWGEIYYPNILHQAIIATEVMRIVPSKTRDLWPLPAESKLIVAQDLVSERNISRPVKITIMSYARSYPITRDINPLISRKVNLFFNEEQIDSLKTSPIQFQTEKLDAIFYGKGRGIHSTTPFSGIYLKEYLADKIKINRKNLRSGLVICAGIDGYRSVYTLSEIMNRSDHSEVLLVPCPEENDGGKFRIFPSCDFFSDRAVKALSEIRFLSDDVKTDK
jgi:hypothetical protein